MYYLTRSGCVSAGQRLTKDVIVSPEKRVGISQVKNGVRAVKAGVVSWVGP